MNALEPVNDQPQDRQPQDIELEQREWLEPTFEKMTMNQAKNDVFTVTGNDGIAGYS